MTGYIIWKPSEDEEYTEDLSSIAVTASSVSFDYDDGSDEGDTVRLEDNGDGQYVGMDGKGYYQYRCIRTGGADNVRVVGDYFGSYEGQFELVAYKKD